MSDFDEAHSAVSVGIAERYLCQSPDMTWEERCDELATAAIEAMQLFIQGQRQLSMFVGEAA
ncbi:MAG TPA: hypothetical protein VE053_06795 [Allosphingosinicella sp.]|nr:hypothetical protein [Allosphingosinicella sp.]